MFGGNNVRGAYAHRDNVSAPNGQASHRRRCCASQVTEAVVQPLQQMHLSEYTQRRPGVTRIICSGEFWPNIVVCQIAITAVVVLFSTTDLKSPMEPIS